MDGQDADGIEIVNLLALEVLVRLLRVVDHVVRKAGPKVLPSVAAAAEDAFAVFVGDPSAAQCDMFVVGQYFREACKSTKPG